MTRTGYFMVFLLWTFCLFPATAPAAPAFPTATPTGIPLDTAWRRQAYAFVIENGSHPAWGMAHSERDFQLAWLLARKEGIQMDDDALFAAAFLHDIGALPQYFKPETDHAARSAELAEPLLRQWGFPREKWPLTKELILGHNYYGPAPTSRAALAFRDADILDFLGSIGIARILALTEERDGLKGTLAAPVTMLKGFAAELPAKCSLPAAREIAGTRLQELEKFLKNLDQESFYGSAL